MADNKVFGYARVSTEEQNLDRQLNSLRQFVASDRDIYTDKASGKDFDRPGYNALLQVLRGGDIVYVHEFTRFGRNKSESLEQLRALQKKGIQVRFLDIPTSMMDYSQFGPMQQPVMEMINNILIEVLATMSEQERKQIAKRQSEGIAAARIKGVKFGRPRLPYPPTWKQDYLDWKAGLVTAVSLYRDKYGISKTTFYELAKAYKSKGL